MKRFFSLWLVLALLLGLALPCLAEGEDGAVRDGDTMQEDVPGEDAGSAETPQHTHTGGSATCQKQAVCEDENCGLPYGELGEHSYTEWRHNDTSHWRVCSVCGEKDEASTETHTWGSGDICACGAEKPEAPKPAEAVKYTIKASAGAGGSISPSDEVEVVAGGSQTFTIIPDSDYEISSISVDSNLVTTSSSYTFENVTENHKIRVLFKKKASQQQQQQVPDFGARVGSVSISVSNRTYSGGAFTGSIVSGTYDLYSNDSMMTCILRALAQNGYSWWGTGGSTKGGYDISYLAGIYQDTNRNGVRDSEEPSLAEFDGGRGSGWMGTLNDWFLNRGFDTVRVGGSDPYGLESGDSLDVVYTTDLGVDVGGGWDGATTTLQSLSISGGTLNPKFSGGTTEYTLTITGSSASVKVTPTAANKLFLTKIFLNTYNQDSSYYKRAQSITVKPGDVIYVGCGDKSWQSMDGKNIEGTKYTITVAGASKLSAEAKAVVDQIEALPEIAYGNYAAQTAKIEAARKAYNALTSTQKAELTTTQLSKLTKAEEAAAYWKKVDDVRNRLKALPSVSENTAASDSLLKQLREAAAAFNALDSKQRSNIPSTETARYEDLRKKLTEADPSLKLDALTGVSATATVQTTPTQAAAETAAMPFSDVKTTDWFYDAVSYVYGNGLFNGVSDTSFDPDASMNRAMLVTVLHRLAGKPAASGTTLAFTDVKAGEWYTDAVAWASSQGIVQGMSETSFAPTGNVTREQMAAILYRYSKSKGEDVSAAGALSTFLDGSEVSNWASEAMAWCVAKGLISGTSGGRLDPQGQASRAQVATILMRLSK